jgi:hypothetical protein
MFLHVRGDRKPARHRQKGHVAMNRCSHKSVLNRRLGFGSGQIPFTSESLTPRTLDKTNVNNDSERLNRFGNRDHPDSNFRLHELTENWPDDLVVRYLMND